MIGTYTGVIKVQGFLDILYKPIKGGIEWNRLDDYGTLVFPKPKVTTNREFKSMIRTMVNYRTLDHEVNG